MKIRMMVKLGMFAFGAALLPMLTAGCNNKPKETARHEEPKTHIPEAPRAIDSILEVQAINGAHNDPSLNASHFDGADLNALGKSKMQMILRGTPQGKPVVVYLDAGRSELTQSRRSAIETYWKNSMMTQAHLELRDGGVETGASAREGLARLPLANSDPEGNNAGAGTSTSTNNNSNNNSGGGTGPQETLFK